MNLFLPVIQQAPLFAGLTERETALLLEAMQVQKQQYKKGSFIFYAGDEIEHISVVLSGMVHVLQEDCWGNRNILTQVRPGGMFGEAFACIPASTATVGVLAVADTAVMNIHVNRILHAGSVLTKPQAHMLKNLLAILAQRNRELTGKIRYMSQRSTRQKLMFYLSAEARRQGSRIFSLPYNRQQMADFLSVDRSAMSAELSKMKKEGLLDYQKNQFILFGNHEKKDVCENGE